MPRRTRNRLALLPAALVAAAALACEDATPPIAPSPSAAPEPYSVPTRDDAALRRVLTQVCESAQTRANRRVLVEFSAAWCSDCRKLDAMKQAPTLARELEDWSHIAINVGRFDRHRDLLDALAIRSIAHWSIFEPRICDAPITDWPRLTKRTLEVSSGDERTLSPADLARWLSTQRGA